VYRKVAKLVGQGLLAKQADVYTTTDRGREMLGSPAFRSALDKPIPQLGLAPTPLHRAVIELILAAAVVRRHGTRDDHHPAFILVGPTLTWKTWTGKMACALLGLNPVDHLLLSNAESGRSLLTRRGYAGTTVSKRSVLSAPLVVIDEFQKADETTRRMADVYLSGSRQVSYENSRLQIRPVPLFAMNPLEGETLEDRTGLDAAQLRRCVVADFSRVTIPADLRSRGGEFLSEATKAGPIDLRTRKPGNCSSFRDVLAESLKRCLTVDALSRVDEELVAQLANGMAAFIPPSEAWTTVVRDLLTIYETLGWTSPGWRLRLPSATPKGKGKVHGGVSQRRRPLSVHEETRRFLAAAGEVPRDLGLAKLIEEEKTALGAARAQLAEMHRQAKATPKQLAEFVKVRQYLKVAGLNWDDEILLWAAQFVASNGSNAFAVARLAYDLFVRGIRGGDADLVLKNLPSGMTWVQAMTWLGDLTRRYGSLDAAVAAKVAEEKAAGGRLAEEKAREEQISAENGKAQEELNQIRIDFAAAQENMSATRSEIAQLVADAERLNVEIAGLDADIKRNKDDMRSTQLVLESQRHLAALYRALEAALFGDERKARTILRNLGADAGDDAVRLLRHLTSTGLGRRRGAGARHRRRRAGTGRIQRR
jgi:hypothetical protein